MKLQIYAFCSSGMQPVYGSPGACYRNNEPDWGPDKGVHNRYYLAEEVDAEIKMLQAKAQNLNK